MLSLGVESVTLLVICVDILHPGVAYPLGEGVPAIAAASIGNLGHATSNILLVELVSTFAINRHGLGLGLGLGQGLGLGLGHRVDRRLAARRRRRDTRDVAQVPLHLPFLVTTVGMAMCSPLLAFTCYCVANVTVTGGTVLRVRAPRKKVVTTLEAPVRHIGKHARRIR